VSEPISWTMTPLSAKTENSCLDRASLRRLVISN